MSGPLSPDRADGDQPPRAWPAGRAYAAEECVVATCGACAVAWQVHRSMAGFRLRCECGAWVDVPAARTTPLLGTGDDGLPSRSAPSDAVVPHSTVHSIHAPLSYEAYEAAPPLSFPAEAGALEAAHPRDRAAWTNRTILEFVAFLAAIFIPQILAFAVSKGREHVLLLPFASIASALLVIIVAAVTRAYGTAALRPAKARYWIEALVVAGLSVALAMLWIAIVRSTSSRDLLADDLDQVTTTLGAGWSVLVFALVPAFVEEIAFRGALQGRTSALFGARSGLWITALLFAMCHMAPVVFPIHFGLGLYLGWLRQRGGSVLPGMLCHCAYNATVILLSF